MSAVRPATTDDARAISEVQVLGWRHAYRGILADEFLADLSIDRREPWWHHQIEAGALTAMVVEDDEGEVVGFASAGPGGRPREAELFAIYLHPQRIGQGLGRSLMLAMEQFMAEQRYEEAILWVFSDNTHARRFYEQAGWSTDGAIKVEEIGGVQPTQLRYRRQLG